MTEDIPVLEHCRTYERLPGLWEDSQIESHRTLTERIHAAGGRIGAQIYHAGRTADPNVNGCRNVAPSAVRGQGIATVPRALTEEEIGGIAGVNYGTIKNCTFTGAVSGQKSVGAIAGINGGEYESQGNWGGKPKGLVVCNGEIQYNKIERGDVMVGFNNDNILVIKDLTGMSKAQVENMVKEEGIRDAVSFKDVDDGDDNHFTKLIINGETLQFTGNGSGANPRTAIGQRSDGAVLMLVTDGRGHNGHVGATAADLVSIMSQYGAVNAANLDGGSSSAMYYNGTWEMNSVTLYYATTSWRLPTGFVVK